MIMRKKIQKKRKRKKINSFFNKIKLQNNLMINNKINKKKINKIFKNLKVFYQIIVIRLVNKVISVLQMFNNKMLCINYFITA